MSKTLVIIALLITFTACQKDVDPFAKVEVDFSFPDLEKVDTLYNGDTLNINGTISSNAEMHGFEITIKDSSNHVLEYIHEHEDGINFKIDESWVNNAEGSTSISLIISVFLTHDVSNPLKKDYKLQYRTKEK